MNNQTNRIKLSIENIKETSWSTILILSILYCAQATFINLVVFKSNILAPISRLTFGLVNQTLVVNIIDIILFVSIIILRYGKLSLYDIGIKKNRIKSAAVVIFFLWVSIQLLNIVFGLITLGKPVFYSGWAENGALIILGNFFGQIFGNCPFEEMVFRGFLLVQFCKKFKGTKGGFIKGIVFSQLIFALIHIPNRILGGMSILEILPSLVIVFVLGVLFAVVYLITDNLFLAIGIHALWNMPLLIFEGSVSIFVLLTFIILLPKIWDRTFGSQDSRLKSSL